MGYKSVKFKIAHTFVQGRGHIKNNIPCQDYVYEHHWKGISVVALADGAGSASHSDIGAEVVCKVVSEWIGKLFGEFYNMDSRDFVYILAGIIKDSLANEALQRNVHVKSLASTLLFVASDGTHYIAGHLGDGIIGYANSHDNEYFTLVLSYPLRNEFFNTTYFTTSDNIENYIRVYKGPMLDIRGFILLSDGAEESLYNRKQGNFPLAVNRLFQWLASYSSEQVNSALKKNCESKLCLQTQDDCGIGLMLKL